MNRNKEIILLSLTTYLTLLGCSSNKPNAINLAQADGLRPLTTAERSSDFDSMVTTIRDYYGPLDFKEKRFGFKLDDLVQEYRPLALATKTDAENFGILKKFLARLHDGHVSIRTNVSKSISYNVPLLVTPVENRALIAKITDPELTEQTGIEVGDEIIEVDGKAPMSYLPVILKYVSLATDESNQHLIDILLRRPIFMTELVPLKSTVTLKIGKKDGSTLTRNLIWTVEKNDQYVDREFMNKGPLLTAYSPEVASVIQVSKNEMGDEIPFFMTKEARAALQFVQVQPSDNSLKKHGLEDLSKNPKLFAGLYRHSGKTLLLIRISGYMVADRDERIAWYKATLDEFGRLADVLVIDQTHNPGGSLSYAQSFISLFANDRTAGLVNFLHADRKWLSGLGKDIKDPSLKGEDRNVLELAYKLVESAYDKGLSLTESPISITGLDYIQPANFTFKKPILMLIDELAGSCGDIVPMIMRDNNLATLFGKRTMGLGGNVETGIVLPNSQATVKLTRGLFYTYSSTDTYDLNKPTENNGVLPNIPYSHTVDDTRAGYVKYVNEFSKAATVLVK
jgi:C-terminal processing protease CtpA/Prc